MPVVLKKKQTLHNSAEFPKFYVDPNVEHLWKSEINGYNARRGCLKPEAKLSIWTEGSKCPAYLIQNGKGLIFKAVQAMSSIRCNVRDDDENYDDTYWGKMIMWKLDRIASDPCPTAGFCFGDAWP
jgi:hypothetical protein